MSSKSKRQQTMAKRAREQKVKEKRVLKQEKKAAARESRGIDEGTEGAEAPEAPEESAE